MSLLNTEDSFLAEVDAGDAFPISFSELESAAKKKMRPEAFGYIRSGAGGEETLRKNKDAFAKLSIIPRFLNDVSAVDTSIQLFGRPYPQPFLLAPVGMLKLAHEDAEIAVAKAAANFRVPLIQSTVSSFSIEEIASNVPHVPKWFQLYWSNDAEISYSMVERAEKAGYEAIVLTVDTVMLGWREEDLRHRFSPLKAGYGKGNYMTDKVFLSGLDSQDDEAAIQHILNNIFHPSLSWKHVEELKKRTSLPVLLKGVLHPEDAQLAIEAGIDGIIVSNHGGRQMDGVIPSIDALPAIAEAAKGKIPVLLDSGIRRGSDIVKALALGADAVLYGRPYVYGLAIAGQPGVEKVLANLIQETSVSLALAGAASIEAAQHITVTTK